MSNICLNCGGQIPDGSAFCPNCGTAVPADVPTPDSFCANCGSPIYSGAAFCNKCGAKISAAGQAQPAQQEISQPVQPQQPVQPVQPPVYQCTRSLYISNSLCTRNRDRCCHSSLHNRRI